MCTWIHESDAELICMRFFFFFLRCFNILCYASGFYMLLFFRQMFLMRARVCVLFIGIVQRNWACLTWKSAIEIKSLLLLLLLLLLLQVSCNFSNVLFLSSSSAFPAMSLGFMIFGAIFACVTILYPTIKLVTFCLHGWCMLGVFVASIHLFRTWISRSLSLCDVMRVCTYY